MENNHVAQHFEIVGKKIPLLERRERRKLQLGGPVSAEMDMEMLHFQGSGKEISLQFSELGKKMLIPYEYDMKTDKEYMTNDENATNMILKNAGQIRRASNKEKLDKDLVDYRKKRLLSKKGPEIKISLPSTCMKRNDTIDDSEEENLFKEKMYMVCQQSQASDAQWHTTCVHFPKDTWKLERRRLSHRHSSVGSSLSFSFARLDLACNTPDLSITSTPISGKNFVFPQNKDKEN